MTTILTNAFSINMLTGDAKLIFRQMPLEQARILARMGFESAVGHANTAAIFSEQLGCPVRVNRVNIQMKRGAPLLIGQYTGPRLSEGATTLPEGATITWWYVTFSYPKLEGGK